MWKFLKCLYLSRLLLTCSPIWCLAAKGSWRGSGVVLWCSHTGSTWAAGPILACSHTIATSTNTLGLTVPHKCMETDHRAASTEVPESTSSIQTLVVRASFFSFCGNMFQLMIFWPRLAHLALALQLPERWGWSGSSWCRPEWCRHSSPLVVRSCCSPSSDPWRAPLPGLLQMLGVKK